MGMEKTVGEIIFHLIMLIVWYCGCTMWILPLKWLTDIAFIIYLVYDQDVVKKFGRQDVESDLYSLQKSWYK